MDFNESKNQSHAENINKNRKTLVLLFVMFIIPVALAYAAYFGNWFSGSTGSQGELMQSDLVSDIEDFDIIRRNGKKISGKEFETLYWWLIPIQPEVCDQLCLNLNLFTLNQTYLGLGKESLRINELVVLEKIESLDSGMFPTATSLFSHTGLKAIKDSPSGKTMDLPANYIYLVDPLGNIFMRYPLIKDKKDAPVLSTKLRKDILHLFKYSRLG